MSHVYTADSIAAILCTPQRGFANPGGRAEWDGTDTTTRNGTERDGTGRDSGMSHVYTADSIAAAIL